MTLHHTLLTSVLLVLLGTSSATALEPPIQWEDVEPSRVRIGGRLGVNYSVLSVPTDPVGEPTLLYGSSLSGIGLVVGATAHYRLSTLTQEDFMNANATGMLTGTTTWGVTSGVLYGRHSGSGFARNDDNGQEQSLTLVSHMLHVPILFELERKVSDDLGVRIGLGPELLWSLASDATVDFTNIDTPAPDLQTTDTFHIGLTATAGVVFHAASYTLPVMLRMTWDPLVPGNTRERFEGYVDEQNLGDFEAAFDFQYSLIVGVDF